MAGASSVCYVTAMADTAGKPGGAHRCPRCDAPIYSDEAGCHYHGPVPASGAEASGAEPPEPPKPPKPSRAPPAPRSVDWLYITLAGALMMALSLVAAVR